MNKLATTSKNSLIQFSKEQVELIKKQIAPDATPDELALFLYVSKRSGLDPLSRQIYCIHRNAKDPKGGWTKKMTIQTSVDGFRVIAERSGDYAGQDEPIFTYDQDGELQSATVKVYRFKGKERYCASVGVAFWDEYVQKDREGKPMGLWGQKKHTMLSKVAECIALRKAYPQDLSGLYADEEINNDNIVELNNTITVDSDETINELHDRYMGLLIDLEEQNPDIDSKKFYPENWKLGKTKENYILAIQHIESVLNKENNES